jgi:putative ABC transport system permease protein
VSFVLRMAARELRASWRRLLFFFICVAIGVGAIVTLRSIMQSVRHGLMSEARAMIASDVLIQTNRPWTPDVRSAVDARLKDTAVLAQSESIETVTMVRAERGVGAARVAELRGVPSEYPFYGTLKLGGDAAYSHALVRDRGALVGPELLIQLGIEVGDSILIGGQPFTVRGVIARSQGGRLAGSVSDRASLSTRRSAGQQPAVAGQPGQLQILLKVSRRCGPEADGRHPRAPSRQLRRRALV